MLEKPGEAWLDEFMQAQALVVAESMFFTFAIGQLGAVGRFDRERAHEMIAVMRQDAADLKAASERLHSACLNMLENAERNLG